MGQSLRTATVADITALIAIDTVAAHELQRIQQIHTWVQVGHCYVLTEQGSIVAYAVLHHHFFAQAFIELIMVAETHRKQGLALILLKQLQTMTPTKLFSSTNASHVEMQRLFKKAGFKPSGYIDHLDLDDPELIYVYQNNE